VAYERSIDGKEQVAKVLAILDRCRDGWKRVVWTKANGAVVIDFRSANAKAVWPLCQVRMGKGWISTDVAGHEHSRMISERDQSRLLKVLGVDGSVLEHKAVRTDRRASS
jgi:hypothetical protein